MLDTHTVHTHMRGLRNKLGSHGSYLENRSSDLVTDRRRRMKLGFCGIVTRAPHDRNKLLVMSRYALDRALNPDST